MIFIRDGAPSTHLFNFTGLVNHFLKSKTPDVDAFLLTIPKAMKLKQSFSFSAATFPELLKLATGAIADNCIVRDFLSDREDFIAEHSATDGSFDQRTSVGVNKFPMRVSFLVRIVKEVRASANSFLRLFLSPDVTWRVQFYAIGAGSTDAHLLEAFATTVTAGTSTPGRKSGS